MSSNKTPLRQIPKVELHRHLELSIRHETLKELAPAFGIELPDDKAFRSRFVIEEPMKDLGSVLNKFLDTQLLLASEEILERVAYEACIDAFEKEGIRVLELRYAPTFILDRHDNLSFESIHESICRGIKKAEGEVPIAAGLICIIQRILPVKEAERVTDFAISNKNTFLGLDLADNEEGFDSKPFSPFFMRAKEAGLGITVHAGEINKPNAAYYIKDAVEHLGATRIGHGVQVYKSPEMLNYVKDKNIVLEVCPTSNYLTQAIPGEISNHPIRKLLDEGVQVTINTDDPGIFDTDMIKEYELLKTSFGFSDDDFKKCNEVAFQASFIPEAKKKKAWLRAST